MLELPFQFSRGEYLRLIELGVNTVQEFWEANTEMLKMVFEQSEVDEIKQIIFSSSYKVQPVYQNMEIKDFMDKMIPVYCDHIY